MKLFSDSNKRAPSPRRVRMFLAEKSFDLEIVSMKLHEENRTDEFALKNPMKNLPVLELDDGTCISETVAICRYIESLQPEPNLFGETDLQVALVEMWNRRAEFSFYMPIEFAGGFAGEQVATNARKQVARTARIFDAQFEKTQFLAGDDFSIADITTKVALDFGVAHNNIEIDASLTHFHRWNNDMEGRDSIKA